MQTEQTDQGLTADKQDTGITPELLRCLPTQQGVYTPAQRWDACTAWAVSGNCAAASRLCGVPERTIQDWVDDAEWWPLLLSAVRARLGDEFDGRLTGMIDKSITVAMQALDNPNISAREAAIVLAIAYDKRALHRGHATSRVERVNLGELRTQFARVIDAQPVSNPGEGQTPSPTDSTS